MIKATIVRGAGDNLTLTITDQRGVYPTLMVGVTDSSSKLAKEVMDDLLWVVGGFFKKKDHQTKIVDVDVFKYKQIRQVIFDSFNVLYENE